MFYIEYHIKQVGKILTCTDNSNKIVINKYDNKVSRIVFNLDGTIPGRLYFVLLNPKTQKYSMMPLVNDAITITTRISAYPGIWTGLLLGIEDDSAISDGEIIDQSKVTYVTNEFKKILVSDNFLSENKEDIEESGNPEIEELLDQIIAALEETKDIIEVLDDETLHKIEKVSEVFKTDGEGNKYLADDGEYNDLITEKELDSMLEGVFVDEI